MDPVELGNTLKKIRKTCKVNQEKQGNLIAVDQTAISRIESGTQMLTAIQLKQIADFYGLEIGEIFSNHINYWNLSKRFGQLPSLDNRYMGNQDAHAREVLPLLRFSNFTKGSKYTNRLLLELGLEGLDLISPDEQISSFCVIDIIKELSADKILNKRKIKEWTKQYNTFDCLGSLFYSFESASNPMSICSLLASNSNLMDGIFLHEIVQQSHDNLIIALNKRYELKNENFEKHKIDQLLMSQRMNLFQSHSEYFTSQKIDISYDKKFGKNLEGEAILNIHVA